MIDLLKSTSSLHNSTHILYTKENPKPNRLPKYMIKPLHILHPPFWFILGVLYVRTWVFFIASKRAQDHQNQSPDVKVVPVSVSRLQQFGLAGSSGSSPISSGLCPDHPGSCPDHPGHS